MELHPTHTFVPDGAGELPGFYFLVVSGGTSWFVRVPREGQLTLGRGSQVEVQLDDDAVSRQHARVSVADGAVTVSDLDSHNGTRVNGQRIDGACSLRSGDVVGVGESTLVLHRSAPREAPRRAVAPDAAWELLADELARSDEGRRPVAVAVLHGVPDGAEAAVARVCGRDGVVARDGATGLVAVIPGQPPHLALATASRLVAAAGGARAGLALHPDDGPDAESLVLAARAAAATAAAGQVVSAGEVVTRLDVGGRQVLVADAAMAELYELVRRVARSDLAVLVCGETGAGKESVAHAVHAWSARAAGPLRVLNCAAIVDTLVESALFGHARGAFSGAHAASAGLLEETSGGTVFLDEVGELNPRVQAKLLRALEERTITRVGETQPRPIDVRFVAATNRDLEAAVAAGSFRKDLYFRVGAARVVLPPLRDRTREVVVLAKAFLEEACAAAGRPAPALSPAALRALAAHPWPGNVRELRNAMALAAVTLPADDVVVEPWHLALGAASVEPEPAAAPAPPAGRAFTPIADELRALERRRMAEALDAAGGVQTRAAELIRMPLRTFVLKLKQYGLSKK